MFLAYRFFFLHHDFRTLMGKIQKNTSKVRKFRLSRKFCLLPRNTELNIRPKKVNDKTFIFRLFQFLNFQVYFNHKNPSNSIFVERCVLCISFSFFSFSENRSQSTRTTSPNFLSKHCPVKMDHEIDEIREVIE